MSENNSFWEKIKNDFGYDIFSAKNTENIAKELSDISVLFGNNEKYNFLKGEQNGSMDKWNQMDYEKIKKFIEENKIDDFIKENKDEKSLIEDFENLKNYSELKIKSSKTITEIGNFFEKRINYIAKHITGNEKTLDNASKNYDIVNESDKLFNPNDGKYFKKAKIIKQKIINQNLSTFNGEEKAPKTVKINGTEFSPQEIAEAMGGGKSLNEFIKDNPFKQQQTEEKKEGEEKVNSNLENQANELRKNLSAGLELLNKYTALSNEYLEANNEKENEKLNNLLAFCKKGGKEEGNELDIKYFEKYDKSRNYNAGENFFADLENLKELEQKIQQEKERQEREKQEKERQQLLNQAKVNTYNKLYNGVEGKETSPAKSFDGTDFRDDKNDIVNLNDSNTSFNNIDNPVNAVKNYVVNNIKEAKNLEKLNKQKDEIEATITLCSNQKTLGENKKSFDSKFNEVQEKLDKTKQTVQNNFNNFNSSINEKSKEEVDDIEVKTSTDAQAKIEELNRKKEELIKKVKQEKEAFDKNVEGTKSNNTEKKEKIENDIGNIGKDFDKTNITKDSINELASEIKNVSNSIDPNSLSSDVKTPDFNKDLEEIQKLNKQIENLGKTKNDLEKKEEHDKELKDLGEYKTKAFNNLCSAIKSETEQQADGFEKDKGFCKNSNPVGVREVEKNNLNDNLNQNIKVIFQKKANEIANSKTKSDVDNSMECEENIKETSNLIREASKNRGNFNSFVDSVNKRIEQDRKKIENNEIDKELNEFYDSKLLLNNEVETNEFDSIDTPEDIDKKKQELIDLYKKEYLKNLDEEKEEIERGKKEIDDKESKVGSYQRDKEALLGIEDFENLNNQFKDLSMEINTSYKNVDKLEMDTSRKQEQTREEIEKKLMALASRQQSLSKEKDLKQPEPEPRETQQSEPRDAQLPESEENKEDLRVKIFNGWNNSIENGSGTAEKYEDEEFRDKDGKVVAMQKTKGGKWLGVVAKEFDTTFEERFINKSDSVGEDEKSRKKQEGFLNSGLFEEKTKYTSYSNETIQNENNLDIASEKINSLEENFKEDFETKYNNINVVVSDPKKYNNKTKEELETMETNIKNEKQDLKNKYEEIKKEIENKKNEILEKTEDVKTSVNDINEYTEKNDLLETDVVKELNSKVEILNNKLKYDFKLDDLEIKKQKIEAKMAELAVNEKEVEIAQTQSIQQISSMSQQSVQIPQQVQQPDPTPQPTSTPDPVSTPQQDTAELNLDEEVKAIANTKENSKDELIENNVKLEDKCEQIYKQKGIDNDKEKQYDVKCEELQKSINKLSDDQKKQYSERMEEIIGYSLDMSVNKEKREKIDIDLCEKQRLYIKNNTSNVKDAGVGVKVTDLSENYRRTVGQKSVGLVATVDNIDPKEFYKEGGIPKDVDVGEFNFARFEVQSIAEDEKDEYKGYKIDLKLPKDKNTVDIMADIRELGFEKAMEKYKDAGLEVNIRDKDGNLLSEDKQKEFFEKLQPKSAEESIGLEERKQKMNNESLSKEEREKVRKEFEEIIKRVEKRKQEEESKKAKTTEDLPTKKKNEKEEDSFPEMPNDMSKTLPHGSNFRVPKSENNNPKQQNGGQNMPKNKKPNVRPEITKAMQNEYPGANSVKTKENSNIKNISDAKSNAQGLPGQGQNTSQNINK